MKPNRGEESPESPDRRVLMICLVYCIVSLLYLVSVLFPAVKNCACSPKLTACCAPSIRHRLNVSVGPRSRPMYGSLLNTVESGRPNPTEKILWLAEHGMNAYSSGMMASV